MDRLLVLARHGQSEWNLKNLFTGWKDPGLTDLGVTEAKTAGEKLHAEGVKFDIALTGVALGVLEEECACLAVDHRTGNQFDLVLRIAGHLLTSCFITSRGFPGNARGYSCIGCDNNRVDRFRTHGTRTVRRREHSGAHEVTGATIDRPACPRWRRWRRATGRDHRGGAARP